MHEISDDVLRAELRFNLILAYLDFRQPILNDGHFLIDRLPALHLVLKIVRRRLNLEPDVKDRTYSPQ